MNADEALALCRYVKACCPQQAIDEWTPLAWADHLADYPYADAKEAAKQITAKQPFVTIAEVLAAIKQIRSKRIHEAGDLTPPPELTPVETVQWLKEARRQIADGETVDCDAAYGELKARHLPDMRELMPRPATTQPPPPKSLDDLQPDVRVAGVRGLVAGAVGGEVAS